MPGLQARIGAWVLAHPFMWGVGSAAVLVLLGFAFHPSPVVVIVAGSVLGVVNILQARRRGYCPLPAEPRLTWRNEVE